MTQILYTEGSAITDTRVSTGPLEDKWKKRKFDIELISLANHRRFSIIVVRTGLAEGAAAAPLGEMGYNVKVFSYQSSAHHVCSIAAQGGISATRNYKNGNNSIYHLFYDTIKGEDFRAHETNVYHLTEAANNIIGQCVVQGVPFAREYGGYLDNRFFGGIQVSRTFYARGQMGQQLLAGAYQAPQRQVAMETVESSSRHGMMELIAEDGRARGIAAYDMVTGEIEPCVADAVVLATSGYGSAFFLSTNAMGYGGSAIWRAYRKDAYFTNPCCTQIHLTCILQHGGYQSKLTLMSESLRNDGRIWAPKRAEDCEKDPRQVPGEDRDYYSKRIYPSFGNLIPCDIASRQAKNMRDEDRRVGPKIDGVARGVYLDFFDAIDCMKKAAVSAKCGNPFGMYKQITDDDPYEVPMCIYPAVHYTMDGLWVNYDLESSVYDLYVAGETSFSDHDASRLGASALMQGLTDGYFILSDTMNDCPASGPSGPFASDDPTVVEAYESVRLCIAMLMGPNDGHSADYYHKKLGSIMWERCGIAREVDGLHRAVHEIRALREDFRKDVKVPGTPEELNVSPKKAGRVVDFLEFGELVCIDALHREESCGGHFRVEPQTPRGETPRHDDKYAYVVTWEFAGDGSPPILHKEDLDYELVHMKQRSYK